MAAEGWGVMAFFVVSAAVGGWVAWLGYKQLALKRLIENLPTSKVRSIAMGLVELKGTAQKADKILKAPFTNKDCLYYTWIAEERYTDKDGREHWKTIASGKEGVPFYLKDDTGKVLVDSTGATMEIPSDFEAGSGLGRDPPEQVLTFLKSNKIKFEGWFGINKAMRYRESRIDPGLKLYMLGNAGSRPGVAASVDHTENILIGKGGPVFLITTKEEKSVVMWAGIKAVVAIIFGGALLAGSLLFIMGAFYVAMHN